MNSVVTWRRELPECYPLSRNKNLLILVKVSISNKICEIHWINVSKLTYKENKVLWASLKSDHPLATIFQALVTLILKRALSRQTNQTFLLSTMCSFFEIFRFPLMHRNMMECTTPLILDLHDIRIDRQHCLNTTNFKNMEINQDTE